MKVTADMMAAARATEYFFQCGVDHLSLKFPDIEDEYYAKYLVAYVEACSAQHRSLLLSEATNAEAGAALRLSL